ncbi:MAG: hypothetical protein HYY14_01010, partial [Candidatus Omnitrophica bacterium]|nr:hypothetical protein [Candidatus Omnitrophota bacterium]
SFDAFGHASRQSRVTHSDSAQERLRIQEEITQIRYDDEERIISSTTRFDEQAQGEGGAVLRNRQYTVIQEVLPGEEGGAYFDGLGRVTHTRRTLKDDTAAPGLIRVEDARMEYSAQGLPSRTVAEVDEFDSDLGAANLARHFSIETLWNAYNTLGQALRQTRTTDDGSKVTVEDTAEDFTYDLQGRLAFSHFSVEESGEGSFLIYRVVLEGDALNGRELDAQVLAALLARPENVGKTVQDLVGEGILVEEEVVRSGNRSFDVKQTIEAYDDLGQVARQVDERTEFGRTVTERSLADNSYNAQGELESSHVEVHETGAGTFMVFVDGDGNELDAGALAALLGQGSDFDRTLEDLIGTEIFIEERPVAMDRTEVLERSFSYGRFGFLAGSSETKTEADGTWVTTAVSGIQYDALGRQLGFTNEVHRTGTGVRTVYFAGGIKLTGAQIMGLIQQTAGAQTLEDLVAQGVVTEQEESYTLDDTIRTVRSDVVLNELGQATSYKDTVHNFDGFVIETQFGHIQYNATGQLADYIAQTRSTGTAQNTVYRFNSALGGGELTARTLHDLIEDTGKSVWELFSEGAIERTSQVENVDAFEVTLRSGVVYGDTGFAQGLITRFDELALNRNDGFTPASRSTWLDYNSQGDLRSSRTESSRTLRDGTVESTSSWTLNHFDGAGVLTGAEGITHSVSRDIFGNSTRSTSVHDFEIIRGAALVRSTRTAQETLRFDGATSGSDAFSLNEYDTSGNLLGSQSTGTTHANDGFGRITTGTADNLISAIQRTGETAVSLNQSHTDNGDGSESDSSLVTVNEYGLAGEIEGAVGYGTSLADDGFGRVTTGTIEQDYIRIDALDEVRLGTSRSVSRTQDGVAESGQDVTTTYTYNEVGHLVGAEADGTTSADDGFGRETEGTLAQTFEIIKNEARLKTATSQSTTTDIDESRSQQSQATTYYYASDTGFLEAADRELEVWVVLDEAGRIVRFVLDPDEADLGLGERLGGEPLPMTTQGAIGVSTGSSTDRFGNTTSTATLDVYRVIRNEIKVDHSRAISHSANIDGSQGVQDLTTQYFYDGLGRIDEAERNVVSSESGLTYATRGAFTEGTTHGEDAFGEETFGWIVQTYIALRNEAKIKIITSHAGTDNPQTADVDTQADGSSTVQDSVTIYTYDATGIVVDGTGTVDSTNTDVFGNTTTEHSDQDYNGIRNQLKIQSAVTRQDSVRADGSNHHQLMTYDYEYDDGAENVGVLTGVTGDGNINGNDSLGNTYTGTFHQDFAVIQGEQRLSHSSEVRNIVSAVTVEAAWTKTQTTDWFAGDGSLASASIAAAYTVSGRNTRFHQVV